MWCPRTVTLSRGHFNRSILLTYLVTGWFVVSQLIVKWPKFQLMLTRRQPCWSQWGCNDHTHPPSAGHLHVTSLCGRRRRPFSSRLPNWSSDRFFFTELYRYVGGRRRWRRKIPGGRRLNRQNCNNSECQNLPVCGML